MVAAALHDAAREGDGPEPSHAAAGADLARIFLDNLDDGLLFLSQASARKVVRAIAGHNQPGRTRSRTGAALRDADRLRLAWAEGFKPEHFSTATGRLLAAGNQSMADNYVNIYENLGQTSEAPLEIKFELTEACNLACYFCHQGYGRKSSPRSLNFSVYADYLDLMVREGLASVRLTGGEPLMVEDLAKYLALAKRKGLSTILNTNALLLSPGKLKELLPYLDILKISLPAPTAERSAAIGHPPQAWEMKLEAAALAAAYQVQVEFLTPMFPEAIAAFDEFISLLEPLPSIRWVPLRAEPAPGCRRPVKADDMLGLLKSIKRLRAQESFADRWAELKIFLAVPFCLFSSPEEAVVLCDGRSSCGPFSSLTVDTCGRLFRCYSRRRPLRPAEGLRAQAVLAAWEDFEALPELCHRCPVVYRCLGGCRCRAALDEQGFDYLADPGQASRWQA
jgi:radical SAM protein with 4Fe4S-binding SPASM domain